jgi:putative FmdB family regulatory protein
MYDYACADCGEFTALRPLAQWRDTADCPQCGAASNRIVGGAPAI